jgi:hypothetical protein
MTDAAWRMTEEECGDHGRGISQRACSVFQN